MHDNVRELVLVYARGVSGYKLFGTAYEKLLLLGCQHGHLVCLLHVTRKLAALATEAAGASAAVAHGSMNILGRMPNSHRKQDVLAHSNGRAIFVER